MDIPLATKSNNEAFFTLKDTCTFISNGIRLTTIVFQECLDEGKLSKATEFESSTTTVWD